MLRVFTKLGFEERDAKVLPRSSEDLLLPIASIIQRRAAATARHLNNHRGFQQTSAAV